MTTLDKPVAGQGLEGINPNRLFLASCMSLISTAVVFGIVTSFMDQVRNVFGLSNTQVGMIGGATLYGFAISIFVLGPLCDVLGMRFLMRTAFICHFVGVILMVGAQYLGGFWALYAGALVIALGNGTVEAACNPLIATIYPTKKTQKLNQFHMWFPGGIVIGGLAAYFLDNFIMKGGIHNWQIKLLLVLIPTVLYGFLFAGQKFPPTERAQSGITFGGMMKATFLRPLFIILFFCMMITASLELAPGRWMGAAMGEAMKFAGDDAGILVLVYGTTLMAVLRGFAGPVVHRLSPTGLLAVSALLGGGGLFMLTFAQSAAMVIIAATIFYIGVCYFWPTMLGVTSERVPKGGELALAILGGTGMLVVGLVTVPIMGFITDGHVAKNLPIDSTRPVLVAISTGLAAPADADQSKKDAAVKSIEHAKKALAAPELDKAEAIDALRGAVQVDEQSTIGQQAKAILAPLDGKGTLKSFQAIAASAGILVLVFGLMFLKDLSAGGYKQEQIAH